MFSTQSDNCTSFVHILDIIFLFAAELEEPKIGIWGKGLTCLDTILNSIGLVHYTMGECNTILSAYNVYRHLG